MSVLNKLKSEVTLEQLQKWDEEEFKWDEKWDEEEVGRGRALTVLAVSQEQHPSAHQWPQRQEAPRP